MMRLNAKWVAAVFAVCSLQVMSPVHSQVRPSKPIKVIVPYSTGYYDLVARVELRPY